MRSMSSVMTIGIGVSASAGSPHTDRGCSTASKAVTGAIWGAGTRGLVGAGSHNSRMSDRSGPPWLNVTEDGLCVERHSRQPGVRRDLASYLIYEPERGSLNVFFIRTNPHRADLKSQSHLQQTPPEAWHSCWDRCIEHDLLCGNCRRTELHDHLQQVRLRSVRGEFSDQSECIPTFLMLVAARLAASWLSIRD